MRKIIGAAHLSMDGVMQGPGGAREDTRDGFDLGGWSMKYPAPESRAIIMELVGTVAKPNDLLLGRRTYDIFAGYWPDAPADDPIGPVFTKANKYVVTVGAAQFSWANTHAMRSIDEIKTMRAGDGAEVVIWGSSTLYPQLLEADLIDRLVLLTYPVVLGKGKRLFGHASRPLSMKLVSSQASSAGAVITIYDRAG